MNFLITGVAGFIAARTAALLLDQGHRVTGVDNLNAAYDVRLKAYRLRQLQARPGFRFWRLDVADRDALEPVRRHGPYDGIVHLAARAGVRASVDDPWAYYRTNVVGTLNILELARGLGIPKVVLASTSSVYAGLTPPFREDMPTDRPLSPYAASKKAAEVLAYTYHYLYNIDVSVVRYFTVYGPAGRPDMSLFRFVQWISEGKPVIVFGDGQQSRDFTYVDDIARGTIAALRPLGYEILNLGSDTPVVLMDAIRLVERLVGREAHIIYHEAHPADVRATWADISKAERLLRWRPQTTFEEGVASLVRWYQENREWASQIETGV